MVYSLDQDRILPIISLKVLYRSKSVMKSGSILKPRYIGSRYIGSTVYLYWHCKLLFAARRCFWFSANDSSIEQVCPPLVCTV